MTRARMEIEESILQRVVEKEWRDRMSMSEMDNQIESKGTSSTFISPMCEHASVIVNDRSEGRLSPGRPDVSIATCFIDQLDRMHVVIGRVRLILTRFREP